MIEVSLFRIVLGLIPITLAGLFVTAYLQYMISWNLISIPFLIDLLLPLIHGRSKLD